MKNLQSDSVMAGIFGSRLVSLVLLVSVLFAAAASGDISIENEYLRVVVGEESGRFEITAKESGKLVVRDGRLAGEVSSAKKVSVSDSIWGDGDGILVEHSNGWESKLWVIPGDRFVRVHTLVVNRSAEPYVVASEELLEYGVDLGLPVSGLKSFGTGFLSDVDSAAGSFCFGAVVDPQSRRGVVSATLTQDRGSGVFFTDVKGGRCYVRARVDFGRYQVDPGQSRETETILIGYFDDARFGLEAYADAVAKQYAIKLKPEPSVYCTWYHAKGSNEKDFLANCEFASKHLKPFGLSVAQIDNLWQTSFPKVNTYSDLQKDFVSNGPFKVFVESNETYPHGMDYTAEKLEEMGIVAGLWFMPFAGTWTNPYFADKQEFFAHWPDGSAVETRWSGTLLDMSNPKTQDFVRERIKRIYDWGYRYFKIDGIHTGAVTHNVYVNAGYATSGSWLNSRNFVGDQQAGFGQADVGAASTVLSDPRMTHIEAYRKGLEIMREAAPGVFILGCNISQNMRSMGGAFGLIDAMRTGPDNGMAGSGAWKELVKGPYHGSNLYFLNGRVWHNDPDPIYVRPANPLHKARLMASWVAISGSMLTTSYNFADLPDDRLDILKRVMPGHDAVSRPVDLFESRTPRIWLLSDESGGVRRNVVGLFNWKEKEADTVSYDMGRLGLDVEKTYVGFDYWADEFTEPICGRFEQELEAGSCKVLALRAAANHPQLVSTSRHITQGVVDVLEERWDAAERNLSGCSLVVGGDPYELRISVPEYGEWKVGQIIANGAEVKKVSVGKRGIRVVIESGESQEVQWEIGWR